MAPSVEQNHGLGERTGVCQGAGCGEGWRGVWGWQTQTTAHGVDEQGPPGSAGRAANILQWKRVLKKNVLMLIYINSFYVDRMYG